MGNTTQLLDLLFGDYRRRVLAHLLLQPDATFHVRELARLTDTSPGTLSRELGKLTEAGLLRRTELGNQVRYQANRECPVFDELAGLFRKTSGAAALIAEALQPLAERIGVAFVFGSVARGRDSANSDIDVLVLGEVGFTELVQALHPAQQALHREVNPVLYSPGEFAMRVQRGEAFARELLAKPKVFLIGSAHELGELAGDQAPADAHA